MITSHNVIMHSYNNMNIIHVMLWSYTQSYNNEYACVMLSNGGIGKATDMILLRVVYYEHETQL